MTTAVANSLETPGATANNAKKTVGAVVVGGDYQGLGIVRSLGRRKVPVCVIDDERSIARFSKYTTHVVPVDSLRDEKQTVEHILEIGRRLNLRGWVLYPTRDETVAALSRYRSSLTEFFRVPTPAWDTTQWVWDKRNTYRRARELGVPTPSTWYVNDLAELENIDGEPPFVIKPAIKEHFVYSTKAKAWRANNRNELREMFQRAAALVGPGEVMIQSLIPGDGRQQFAYCAFYKEGKALGSMVVRRARQHPPEFGRSSTYVETIDLPQLEVLSERFLQAINYYGLVELEYKLDPAISSTSCSTSTGARGVITRWGRARRGFSLYALCRSDGGAGGDDAWPRRRQVDPADYRFAHRICRNLWGPPEFVGLPAHSDGISRRICFQSRDPLPGLVELALIPYLAVKRGF